MSGMEGLFLVLPLFGVNIWHGILLYLARSKTGTYVSISESAVVSMKLLRLHRVIHILGATSFIAFAVSSYSSLQLSAVVLVLAAVFDMLQVAYLNKNTNHSPFNLHDPHQLLAWAMAAGYMLFCLLFAIHEHVPWVLVSGYLAALLLVAIWNYLTRFANFWLAQMVFFVLTSLMMGFVAYKSYLANTHLAILPRENLLLGAVVMAPALGYVFRRVPFGKHWSISLHASARRDTTFVFGGAMLIATALLAVYFEGWLIPKYDYGVALRYALRAAITCLALLAAIPHYEGKWQGRVHVAVSWTMVVLMPVILLLHALENWGTMGGYLALLAIAIQATLLGIFWGINGMYERFALLQSIFIAVFFAAIAILGYL